MTDIQWVLAASMVIWLVLGIGVAAVACRQKDITRRLAALEEEDDG